MGPIVTQHRLAFTLHIILIAIHVVLVIVWSKHYERGFTLNQDSETLATLQHQALTVLIPQTFAIIYLGAILTLSQRLALSRANARSQTLTSLHDQVSAWNGFGAALLAIRDQFRLRTAFPQIICIAIYLGAFTTLHISTPALFSVDGFPFDKSLSGQDTYQNITSFLTVDQDLVTSINDLYSSSQILPAYDVQGLASYTPGLSGAMVFDSISTRTAFDGYASVFVDEFRVRCGTVPQANLTMTTTGWTISAPVTGFNVHILDGLQPAGIDNDTSFPKVNARFPIIYPTSSTPDIASNFTSRPLGPNIFFYLIVDPNVDDPPLPDNKGISPPTINVTIPSESKTFSFLPVGCSVSVAHGTGQIDTSTATLTKFNIPEADTNPHTWAPWVPLPTTETGGPDKWSLIYWPEAGTAVLPSTPPCNAFTTLGCPHLPTTLEKFVSARLYGGSITPANNSLVALENALADLTAIINWNYRFKKSHGATIMITETGEADHLNLHTWPVFVGLGCSLVLFPLAIYLLGVRSPRTPDGQLENSSAGLLQVALGGVKNQVADAVLGSEDEKGEGSENDRSGNVGLRLRKAGMSQVLGHISSLGYI